MIVIGICGAEESGKSAGGEIKKACHSHIVIGQDWCKAIQPSFSGRST